MRRLVLAAIALTACQGSSPTEPDQIDYRLATEWGEIQVVANDLDYSPSALLAAIQSGYSRARAQIGARADVSLVGMRVFIMPDSVMDSLPNSPRANGAYVPSDRAFLVREGVESVLDHEIQHYIAAKIIPDSGCETACCHWQDHGERREWYDLNCASRTTGEE